MEYVLWFLLAFVPGIIAAVGFSLETKQDDPWLGG